MKEYPKTYENVYNLSSNGRVDRITSTFGSAEKLAEKFKTFYKEAHIDIFDIIVKEVWLERQFVYDKYRRLKSVGNGYSTDWAFGFFMKAMVGISQKPITKNPTFTFVLSYLNEFFPDFLEHDPFVESEYYKFPFKHITLDHLAFVYQMTEVRMELLRIADERLMPYADFVNWVANYVFCYNDEVGKDIYSLSSFGYMRLYIKNNTIKRVKGRGFMKKYE